MILNLIKMIIFDWSFVHFLKIHRHMKSLYLLSRDTLMFDRFDERWHLTEWVNSMLWPHQTLSPNPWIMKEKKKRKIIQKIPL